MPILKEGRTTDCTPPSCTGLRDALSIHKGPSTAPKPVISAAGGKQSQNWHKQSPDRTPCSSDPPEKSRKPTASVPTGTPPSVHILRAARTHNVDPPRRNGHRTKDAHASGVGRHQDHPRTPTRWALARRHSFDSYQTAHHCLGPDREHDRLSEK
jgi:hypothetical protein